MTYCAFVVCALLDDWSCIDLARARSYIHRCRVRSPPSSLCPDFDLLKTYEGGYGQTPNGESLGGPTYCALAALYLVPPPPPPAEHAQQQQLLQPAEWRATVRWLLQMQTQTQTQAVAELGGGFAGRTNKLPDACYGFWCGAALSVRPVRPIKVFTRKTKNALPSSTLIYISWLPSRSSVRAICSTHMRLVRFLRGVSLSLAGSARRRANTQVCDARSPVHICLLLIYKHRQDPYHTYLSIAAAAVVSPDPKWGLQPLDPLINATPDTVRWAKMRVRGTASETSDIR